MLRVTKCDPKHKRISTICFYFCVLWTLSDKLLVEFCCTLSLNVGGCRMNTAHVWYFDQKRDAISLPTAPGALQLWGVGIVSTC